MPSRRVAVTSPQTRLAHARRRVPTAWRPPTLDPTAAERAMGIYTRQRRLAIVPILALFAVLLGIPVVLSLFPALDDVRLVGIPLSWLAMAALPYPAMIALARWQLLRAEKAEDDQADDPVDP